jgi:hypothetical protein
VQNFLYSSLLSKNIKVNIYRNVILSVVSYGSQAWSVTVRENNVVRKTFGSKWDQGAGKCTILRNDEL